MDWKKEIKLSDLFRRERKPKAPKSSTPFWKKELSLRRKPKRPAELVPVADEDWIREQLALAEAAAAAAENPLPKGKKKQKQSLLKKEISFKRKPKAPKEPKERKQKGPKAPKGKAPPGAKTPKRLVGLKI